jgi:nicotinamide riboside kinase
MQIAITGPHSSGKTTLLERLRKEDALQGFDFLPEVTRIIKEQGYNINEGGTIDTQLLVMAKHVENILLKKHSIVDRAILDGAVYTSYLYGAGSVPKWVVEYCGNLLKELLPRYDLLLYIPAEFEVKADGVRSHDPHFHRVICQLFDTHIKQYSPYCQNLVQLTGSVDERVEQSLKAIQAVKEGN